MKVFIVGQVKSAEEYKAWEFVGVYTTKELAESMCISPLHFVGEAPLDDLNPHFPALEWPGAYYPKA